MRCICSTHGRCVLNILKPEREGNHLGKVTGNGDNIKVNHKVVQEQDGTGSSSVLFLLASCQQTCMTYTTVVCTVKNS
jgi:hypothetical protein